MQNTERIAELEADNARLRATIAELEQQVQTLLAQVQDLQGPRHKDSHNSSKPPSSDGLRRPPKSLRKRSGKKPGGQPDHLGHTLKLVATPDQVVELRPETCAQCQAP